MSIDKSLGPRFPTVEIAGEPYQYGKVPPESYWRDGEKAPYPDEWVVEHRHNATDSWYFRTEREMVDFLENLPDSAVRPTLRGAPLWQFGSHDPVVKRIGENHQRWLAGLLRKKRRAGTTFRYRG